MFFILVVEALINNVVRFKDIILILFLLTLASRLISPNLIFSFRNISADIMDSINTNLNIEATKDLCKYLVVSVIIGCKQCSKCNSVCYSSLVG